MPWQVYSPEPTGSLKTTHLDNVTNIPTVSVRRMTNSIIIKINSNRFLHILLLLWKFRNAKQCPPFAMKGFWDTRFLINLRGNRIHFATWPPPLFQYLVMDAGMRHNISTSLFHTLRLQLVFLGFCISSFKPCQYQYKLKHNQDAQKHKVKMRCKKKKEKREDRHVQNCQLFHQRKFSWNYFMAKQTAPWQI